MVFYRGCIYCYLINTTIFCAVFIHFLCIKCIKISEICIFYAKICANIHKILLDNIALHIYNVYINGKYIDGTKNDIDLRGGKKMALAKNVELIAIEEMMLIEEGLMEPDERLGTSKYWYDQKRCIIKGTPHIAEFSIWTKGKRWTDDDGEEHPGGFYMRKACFWKTSQTRPLTEKELERWYKKRRK